MEDKEVLLKAFELMIKLHTEKGSMCNGIECEECPFIDWDICPIDLREVE